MAREIMENQIGTYPKESNAISIYRKHMGWCRTCGLIEPEGQYLDNKKNIKRVYNRIICGETSLKNFLSVELTNSAKEAVNIRK